jgi:hypothetical protein
MPFLKMILFSHQHPSDRANKIFWSVVLGFYLLFLYLTICYIESLIDLHTNLPDPVPSSTSSGMPVPRQQLYSIGTDRGRGFQSRRVLLSWGRTMA